MSVRRGRVERTPPARAHPRFKVGDVVAVINTAGAVLPRHEERELLDARFEVTRQLPDRQQSFHYRIKDTMTGQERAVTEERLREAAYGDRPEHGEPEIACEGQDNFASTEPRVRSEYTSATPESRPVNDDNLNLRRAARPASPRGR